MLEEVRPNQRHNAAREVTGGEFGDVGVRYSRQRECISRGQTKRASPEGLRFRETGS